MKAKLIIIGWLGSLMLMATDNLLQASIALCLFAYSSYKLTKHKEEVKKAIKGFENKLIKLINKQSI